MEAIEHVCEELRLRALAANRPFLAHLLEMVVVESRTKRDLPIEELRAIAESMRTEPLIVSATAVAGGRTWRARPDSTAMDV